MRFLEDLPISFPGLGIENIDPPSGFTLFGTDFEIRFYGVIIALGLFLAVVYCMLRSKQFGLTSDNILDVALVGVPCAVVGARLYYVILYGVEFSQWLNIRDGGLAIYGGVIAAVLGVAIFSLTSKARRLRFLPSADIAGLGLLIGQSIGRWGNFFNREAFGGYCDNILAMRLPDVCIRNLADSPALQELKQRAIEGGYQGFVQVHPTFLYESLWNFAGLILLHFLSKKRRFDGQIFLGYLAWYGLGRFFIEGLRTDSLMSGSLRTSQVVALISFVGAVALLVCIAIRKPDPANMLVNRNITKQETEEQSNDA